MYSTKILGLAIVGFAAATTTLASNITATHHSFTTASYNLVDTYNSNNFFASFDFYNGPDPTHGWVNYRDQGSAASAGLINTNYGQVYLGVDYWTVNPPAPGRASVRLESKKAYNHGLFIADIAHM